MVADSEELEQMDASELHARRLNAKEVLMPMKGENFLFPAADGTVNISGEEQDLRTSTSIWDSPDRGEERDNLQGESDGSSSTSRQDSSWSDGEAKGDFRLRRKINFTNSKTLVSQSSRPTDRNACVTLACVFFCEKNMFSFLFWLAFLFIFFVAQQKEKQKKKKSKKSKKEKNRPPRGGVLPETAQTFF